MDLPNTPEELHALVDGMLADPTVDFHAQYQVDAAEMVNAIVPRANRGLFERIDWLDRILNMYAFKDYPGWDQTDPLLITEHDGEVYPINPDRALPAPPMAWFCAHCQDVAAAEARAAHDAGVAILVHDSVRAVHPVRLSRGARAIQLLLCADCITKLGVEPSHA